MPCCAPMPLLVTIRRPSRLRALPEVRGKVALFPNAIAVHTASRPAHRVGLLQVYGIAFLQYEVTIAFRGPIICFHHNAPPRCDVPAVVGRALRG